MKPATLPFLVLAAQTSNDLNQTMQSSIPTKQQSTIRAIHNNSFMSYTDQSDSDSSMIENQSMLDVLGALQKPPQSQREINMQTQLLKGNSKPQLSINSSQISYKASIGGTPSQKNIQKPNNFFEDQNKYQSMKVEQKKYFHPYADKPTPLEEWVQIIIVAIETVFQFVTMDIIGNSLYYSGKFSMYILLLPMALLGLLAEYLRKLKGKCCKKSDTSPFHRSKSKQDFFEGESPKFSKGDFIIVLDLDMTLVYSSPFKPNPDDSGFISMTVENQMIHVYKRPYLDQFLDTLANMGQVYLFTASTKVYADPIIDEIDPKGIIKGRFYREHCKTDKLGNLIKPMEQITTNQKKMIIIDDSELTYNMYKQNTIMVDAWTNLKKKDKQLKECITIMEQLRISNPKDVRPDLKSLIDIHHHYK